MKFIIQSTDKFTLDLFPETSIFKDIVYSYDRNRTEYEELSIAKLRYRIKENDRYKDYYPIGNIPFINLWLNHFYNRHMQPIEIPKVLRTDEYLKRSYKICHKDEVPKHGNYFIKNVSKLKAGSYLGSAENWQLTLDDYDDATLFSVSNSIPILSEWRIYYIDNHIVNICNYDGDCTMFPNTELIKRMITDFVNTGSAPKDFSLDVGINNNGTFILEIHPFAALGLYSTIWDESLIDAYKHGIDWYINNKYSL